MKRLYEWTRLNAPPLLLVIAVCFLGGCGSGDGIVGRSQSSSGSVSATTTLKEDGTYEQKLVGSAGQTFTNTGKWQKAQPMGIPGVPTDGSYLQLDNYLEDGNLKPDLSNAASAPRTTMLMPASEFSPTQQQMETDKNAQLFWIVTLRLGFLALWIAGIVDAARREFPSSNAKIGWILVTALLGCLGAVIYFAFGRSDSWLPGQEPQRFDS